MQKLSVAKHPGAERRLGLRRKSGTEDLARLADIRRCFQIPLGQKRRAAGHHHAGIATCALAEIPEQERVQGRGIHPVLFLEYPVERVVPHAPILSAVDDIAIDEKIRILFFPFVQTVEKMAEGRLQIPIGYVVVHGVDHRRGLIRFTDVLLDVPVAVWHLPFDHPIRNKRPQIENLLRIVIHCHNGHHRAVTGYLPSDRFPRGAGHIVFHKLPEPIGLAAILRPVEIGTHNVRVVEIPDLPLHICRQRTDRVVHVIIRGGECRDRTFAECVGDHTAIAGAFVFQQELLQLFLFIELLFCGDRYIYVRTARAILCLEPLFQFRDVRGARLIDHVVVLILSRLAAFRF